MTQIPVKVQPSQRAAIMGLTAPIDSCALQAAGVYRLGMRHAISRSHVPSGLPHASAARGALDWAEVETERRSRLRRSGEAYGTPHFVSGSSRAKDARSCQFGPPGDLESRSGASLGEYSWSRTQGEARLRERELPHRCSDLRTRSAKTRGLPGRTRSVLRSWIGFANQHCENLMLQLAGEW